MAEKRYESEDEETDVRTAVDGFAGAIGTRNLLIIIFTMPLVFVGVITAIIMVFGKPKDDEGERPSTVVSTPAAASPSREAGPSREVTLALPASAGALAAAITLPEDAEPGQISLDGDRLAVSIKSGAGDSVVIYDLVQNRVVQTVPLIKVSETASVQTVVRTPPAQAAPVRSEPASANSSTNNETTAPGGQRGLTLAAPGQEPLIDLTTESPAGIDGQDASLNTLQVPTPSLGSRRTRLVTTVSDETP